METFLKSIKELLETSGDLNKTKTFEGYTIKIQRVDEKLSIGVYNKTHLIDTAYNVGELEDILRFDVIV